MNIVIIRFSSMGDVLLQTSFVRWLKLNIPQSKVFYITSKEFVGLLDNNPDIDQVIEFDRKQGTTSLLKLSSLIQKDLRADIVFDLHQTLRARILYFLCFKVNFITVDKRSLERLLLVNLKLNLLKTNSSIHDRLVNDFRFLISNSQDLKKFPKTRFFNDNQVQKKKRIIFSPVASFENKKWPLSYYKELLELLLKDSDFSGYEFIILGGPNDDDCIDMMIDSPRVTNFQGKLDLKQTAAEVSSAQLVVTNDTGIAHISESVGTKCYVFFGPTVKEFGFAPHLPDLKIFETNLSCRPCSTTGKKACSQEDLFCMKNIKPKDVYLEIRSCLE